MHTDHGPELLTLRIMKGLPYSSNARDMARASVQSFYCLPSQTKDQLSPTTHTSKSKLHVARYAALMAAKAQGQDKRISDPQASEAGPPFLVCCSEAA